MQATLQSLHTIPGVIGGMLVDDNGTMLSHSFPPVFDLQTLQGISSNLNYNIMGLHEPTGGAKLLDLRFEHGRVVIKTMPNQFLLLLCEQTVNLHLLLISVNVATKKLEKMAEQGLLTAPPPQPQFQQPPPQLQPPPVQQRPVQTPPEPIRTDQHGVILTVEILKKTASTFWDSMADSASIGKDTSVEICNHFNIAPFKHLVLHNRAQGKSARVPVQVIQVDKTGAYNNKIVVTLSVAEQLKVINGDQVHVTAIVGGGMFGWEGI